MPSAASFRTAEVRRPHLFAVPFQLQLLRGSLLDTNVQADYSRRQFDPLAAR